MNIREMTLMMGIKGSINDTNSNKNKIDRSTISSKQIKELMKTHHIYMNWKKAHKNPDWFKLPDTDSRKWGFELVADVDVPENELRSAKETSDRILENIYAYLEKKSKSLSDNDMAIFYVIKKYFDNLEITKTDKDIASIEMPLSIPIISIRSDFGTWLEGDELVRVPKYIKNQEDGQLIPINAEIKKKLVKAFSKNILSILNSTNDDFRIDDVKNAIKSERLKITEVHDKQADAFTAMNAQVQLIVCGDKVGIKLKDSI